MTISLSRSARSKEMPLRLIKEQVYKEIIRITNISRAALVPSIIGQEMTYREKETQASNYLSLEVKPTEDNSISEFSFIFEEVGITADTPQGVAEKIISAAVSFREIGSRMERLRLSINKDIEDASTEATIDSLLKDFISDMKELTGDDY